MLKSIYRSATVAAFGGVLLLTGCAQGGGAAVTTPNQGESAGGVDWSTVEPVELTVSSQYTPGMNAHDLMTEWASAVTEVSEGRITFNIHEAGVLSGAREELSAMSSGLADIVPLSSSYHPDQLPVSNWVDRVVQDATIDFGYPNTNIAGSAQFATHNSTSEDMLTEMAGNGFMPLLTIFTGPSVLTCTEPFESPADLAGRQVRVGNAVQQGEYESLGMKGVFLPVLEQYEALQRGVVDCAVNGVLFVEDLLEVAPHASIPNTAVSPFYWAISTDAWSKFSPEVQKVLMDLRLEPLANYSKAALGDYAKIPDGAKAAGGELVDPSELNGPIAKWWADQPPLEQRAPSAVKDPAAVIAQINENATWWLDYTTTELDVPAGGDLLDVLRRGDDVVDWSAWTETLRTRFAEISD